jgi:hypothetical protein
MTMLKYLAALLIAGPALADTTTLDETTTCAPAAYCTNVLNSAGWTINDIVWAPQYKRLTAFVDGESYDSGLYKVVDPNPLVLENVTLRSPSNAVITISVTYSTYQTCSRFCTLHYVLTGGKIVR